MINNDWDRIFKVESEKEYFKSLIRFLDFEYKNKTIYPEKDDIFNALKYCSYKDTKVVIIGQDPYHGPNQAHGLSFSVQDGIKLPKSLINIYKEIETDLGIKMGNNGNLEKWAKQGVLLLNTVLTVEEGKPNSHKNKGWETFTDMIIKTLVEGKEHLVFILWGKEAKLKEILISNNHIILKASHPSPLSAYRGFFGCNHFSKTNQILRSYNKTIIDWKI